MSGPLGLKTAGGKVAEHRSTTEGAPCTVFSPKKLSLCMRRPKLDRALAPGGKIPQRGFLLWGLDSMASRLADISYSIGYCHPLRNPVSGGKCPRPSNPSFAVNDRFFGRGQLGDQPHELFELVDCRGAEVLHRDTVSHEAQTRSAGNIVLWRLFLLLEQRDEHPEAVTSQLFEIGDGGVSASKQTRVVDPPSIHRPYCYTNESTRLRRRRRKAPAR